MIGRIWVEKDGTARVFDEDGNLIRSAPIAEIRDELERDAPNVPIEDANVDEWDAGTRIQ